MDIEPLYRQLIGFKKNRAGELIIPGARDRDYERIVETILDEIRPAIHDSLDGFIHKVHCEYIRYFKNKVEEMVIRPRMGETLNTRQVLTLLKFYLYRRTYSRY